MVSKRIIGLMMVAVIVVLFSVDTATAERDCENIIIPRYHLNSNQEFLCAQCCGVSIEDIKTDQFTQQCICP